MLMFVELTHCLGMGMMMVVMDLENQGRLSEYFVGHLQVSMEEKVILGFTVKKGNAFNHVCKLFLRFAFILKAVP